MTAYHHGDLRAALLQRARSELSNRDPTALSLRALAASIGVSANAPYRHFPTKESLLAALAAEGFAELTENFSSHDARYGRERLVGYLREYIDYASHNAGLYRLMFGRDLDPLSCDPQLGLRAQACFRALVTAVAHVLDTPEDSPEARGRAALVWSLSHGAALLTIDHAINFLPAIDRPTPDRLADLLMDGFRR